MKKERFKEVLASALFMTLLLSALAGVIWSAIERDWLFGLAFVIAVLQTLRDVILDFKESTDEGGQS